MGLQPAQDIAGQLPVMRPGFDNLDLGFSTLDFAKPPGKLKSQQLAKEIADPDTGIKITTSARIVFFCLVISMFGTVKSEFHEALKGQNATLRNLAANDFRQRIHVGNLA